MKIVTVAGARPQFIKAFALSRALAEAPDFDEVLIHTGQHFDDNMSAVFFDELGIRPPDHHFKVGQAAHGAMTGEMLERIEQVLLAEKPAAVIVYGDTNSTLAGALAAAKLGIALVHVEAGLRSFNRAMPEEINRVVADHVSDLLFCPTRAAIENLAREGITQGVHRTGDLMVDAMRLATPIAERNSTILETVGVRPSAYAVATIHRAANTDDRQALAPVLDYLAEASRKQPVVFPVHPRTVAAMKRAGLDPGRDGIKVIAPVGYLDMCKLLHHASLVLTDSGGVQKEAYFHRVPCITLRDETEWVETIANGWNRLWRGPGYAPRRDIDEYGDGHAAEEMVALLRQALA
ncbi:MAG TPA: UDP-N-acetylglucosamine 2-epimerase (non-hydrolyzing) [Rhizomicrobium sp.]|nr:UDP-N-acetylglucosamine 2-epimerase (non-hydrolyzing) [Rhizomicrobium sp.]